MIPIFIAGSIGMIVSLIGTRVLMIVFARLGKGQPILGAEDHGPVHQMGKQGTPTMGGIAILFAGAIGWTVAHVRAGLPFSDQAAIIWLTVFVLGVIGFLDDFLKVRRQHNRGIFWKKKVGSRLVSLCCCCGCCQARPVWLRPFRLRVQRVLVGTSRDRSLSCGQPSWCGVPPMQSM